MHSPILHEVVVGFNGLVDVLLVLSVFQEVSLYHD